MPLSGAIILTAKDIDSDTFQSIVKSLINYGWSFNDYGKISYMTEDYDWQTANLEDLPTVLGIIKLNIENRKDSGLTLTWQDTSIGGSFMFVRSSEIMFSLIVNPLLLKETEIIDFSWYIDKLKPLFDEISIVRIKCIYE